MRLSGRDAVYMHVSKNALGKIRSLVENYEHRQVTDEQKLLDLGKKEKE